MKRNLSVLIFFLVVSCQSNKSKEELHDSTPEKTLNQYISFIQAGNLAGVKSLLCPPDTDFYLPGPVPVRKYEIVKKHILTEKDLKEQHFVPPPKIGDVRLDVIQYFEGDSAMFYYWFREDVGTWKILTLAGPDDC